METKGGMMQIVDHKLGLQPQRSIAYGVLVQWTMQVKKKENSNTLYNFLLLLQIQYEIYIYILYNVYDLFKLRFCIKKTHNINVI